MTRIIICFLAAAYGALLLLPPQAAARDLPISAFYGKFSGGGIAQNADSEYFAVTSRDFDVVIRPEGKGVRIDWTQRHSSGRRSREPQGAPQEEHENSAAFGIAKRLSRTERRTSARRQ